ncbi:MAG: BTAD domain-containing putative transcriptional regulator, partial [Gordonia sp. (in: high G+C Gram-positive bacteria)]
MDSTTPTPPIRVLGPLTVIDDDGLPISLTARKHAELLVLLAVERDGLSAERLADLLWRGSPPRSAAVTLQGYVSRLRKSLAAASVQVVTAGGGYLLRGDAPLTDLELLDALAADGLASVAESPRAAAGALTTALDLWRGEPLPEVADLPEVAPTLARLGELRATLSEASAAALSGAGDDHAALGVLSALIHQHPYRESTAARLARLLGSQGRTADALDVLRGLRRRLAEDLGLDPGPEIDVVESELLAPAVQLSAPSQRLMTLLVISDGPLENDLLTSLDVEHRTVDSARRAGLVAVDDDGTVALAAGGAHDAAVTGAERRRAHLDLAAALTEVRPADLEAIARHRCDGATDADSRAHAVDACRAAAEAA